MPTKDEIHLWKGDSHLICSSEEQAQDFLKIGYQRRNAAGDERVADPKPKLKPESKPVSQPKPKAEAASKPKKKSSKKKASKKKS